MTTDSPATPARKFARLFNRSLSLRFVIVGVANTSFSTILFLILMWLGMGIASGSAVALAAGVLFSYLTQGTVVFRHRSTGAFIRFILAWTVIYFANLLEIRVMMAMGLNRYWAGALATIPTTIVSYLVQRFIVFRTASAAQSRPS